MKPFDREYVLDKIQEYNNKIKNNKIYAFSVLFSVYMAVLVFSTHF